MFKQLAIAGFVTISSVTAVVASVIPNEASVHTRAHQERVRAELPFADDLDFELAERGLIARPEEVTIKDEHGNVVWELGGFDFLYNEAYHYTINPSLERQARLNMAYGLYKVTDRIYQVRGYDLSNITFILGDTGWIVMDPLLTPPTAKAAFELVTSELGEYPIHTVIYSHAHVDHFGGVRGVVDEQDVVAGRVQIIAPREFMEHAIKENVLAGNAMSRRATFQYGNTLEKSPQGVVDAAIGKAISTGLVGLIAPTRIIEADEETLVIDGIDMVFQNTPNTESPSEMNTWFPQLKALWTAENVIGTMHNIYTLRGAETRDALAWSKYINYLIHHYAKDAEVMFASHSWPRWGNEYLIDVLKKQRDLYGFLHDRTLHLANKGVTINQIHNVLEVPDVLAHEWYNRGYHGSYSHNVRGVLNRYLGYFDMNPANLDKLSPEASGPRYVEAMGGEERVLELAQQAYDDGEYRWGAELLNHLVFANPQNREALLLQASMFEQMGYQAESAGWRNVYLTGASELRHGMPTAHMATQMGPDLIQAMSSELIFDFLGVRLNVDRALGHELTINMVFPDQRETYLLELKHGHLNNISGIQSDRADVTVTVNRRDLDLLLTQQKSMADLVAAGAFQFSGDPQKFFGLLQMLDEFDFWFDIVTP